MQDIDSLNKYKKYAKGCAEICKGYAFNMYSTYRDKYMQLILT